MYYLRKDTKNPNAGDFTVKIDKEKPDYQPVKFMPYEVAIEQQGRVVEFNHKKCKKNWANLFGAKMTPRPRANSDNRK